MTAGMSRPFALKMQPLVSLTAITLAPASWNSMRRDRAGIAEALHRHARALHRDAEVLARAQRSCRTRRGRWPRCGPSEPPRLIGLPVTTPCTG